MKKVLIAFDGSNFSTGAFDFAQQLNEFDNILLTGVFLPQIDYATLWTYAGGLAYGTYVPGVLAEEQEVVKVSIRKFESACQRNGIAYRVHKDFEGPAIAELRRETRFADVLIVSSEKFYENLGLNDPNPSLEDVLHDSECPVIVVPEKFTFPASNILAYDGSESSAYAIKQFVYLFPELCDNETTLVYAEKEVDFKFPNQVYVEEFAAQHFKNLTLFKLQENPKKNFLAWVRENADSIVVSGSFGRSLLSLALRRSFLKDVIAERLLPVFVAHK